MHIKAEKEASNEVVRVQPINHGYGHETQIRHDTGIGICQTLNKTHGHDDINIYMFMHVIYNVHRNRNR